MFLYRVKVEQLGARRLSDLTSDLRRSEESLRAQCPIREMSVLAEDRAAKGELDIYLALDDIISSVQIGKLFKQIRSMIHMNLEPDEGAAPRISTEVIHI